MNFKIKKEYFLEDGTKRIMVRIISEELLYLGYFLESFEGWCNYTTIKDKNNLLQIDVSSDFVKDFSKLFIFLESHDLYSPISAN
ncbi:MAG: hypothetical protein HQ534_09360 [Armatimonadetes bacterium]|nr:hypothetical protein [Armatimonadota bacterium]